MATQKVIFDNKAVNLAHIASLSGDNLLLILDGETPVLQLPNGSKSVRGMNYLGNGKNNQSIYEFSYKEILNKQNSNSQGIIFTIDNGITVGGVNPRTKKTS